MNIYIYIYMNTWLEIRCSGFEILVTRFEKLNMFSNIPNTRPVRCQCDAAAARDLIEQPEHVSEQPNMLFKSNTRLSQRGRGPTWTSGKKKNNPNCQNSQNVQNIQSINYGNLIYIYIYIIFFLFQKAFLEFSYSLGPLFRLYNKYIVILYIYIHR